MGDHELEEGEACDDPDSGCDPDTEFSYLDDKLSLVLGDVQKDFEGGVNAQKLGSKYGHYGSFLPTHERASSILNQDKPMGSSNAYGRERKSPCESTVEKIKRTIPISAAGSVNPKVGDGASLSMKENGRKDTGIFDEKKNHPDTTPPVIAGEYAGPTKRVTLRIKMGSERKRNTTIYSDFGLNSSSGSDDDDNDDEEHEDQRSDSDIDSSPDRTPLTMIRIMTSHHIPDGNLLSPGLPDLIEEPFIQKERLWTEKPRSPCLTKLDIGNDSELIKDDGDHYGKLETFKQKHRETASVRKDDNIVNFDYGCKPVKPERGKGNSKEINKSSKPPSKTFTKLMTDTELERQVKDAVSETGMRVRSSESHRESKLEKSLSDYPPYEAEHVPKDFCSPYEPLKEFEMRRAEKVAPSSSHDSMNGPFDRSQQLRDMIKEASPSDMAVHGKRQFELQMELTESKKKAFVKESNGMYEGKANVSQDAKKPTLKVSKAGKSVLSTADVSATSRDTMKDGSEAQKRPKASSRETYASGSSSRDQDGKDSPKETQKSSEKNKHFKENLVRGAGQDSMETLKVLHNSTKSVKKELNQKDVVKLQRTETAEVKKKEKLKEQIKCELPTKEPSRLNEKDRLKDSNTRDTVKLSRPNLQTPSYTQADASEKLLSTADLPPLTTGDALAPTIIITENWVQCDKCETWRLLPPGLESKSLPKRWLCKMQRDWLRQPGMNKCNVPESTTSEATRSLYHNAMHQSAAILTDPSVDGQLPLLGDAPAAVGPATTKNASHDMKVIDKNKLVLGKKRKIPPVSLNETAITKSNTSIDVSQDIMHMKPNSAELNMIQESNKTKVAVVDTIAHAQDGEEKRKVRGRERDKDQDRQKEVETEREKEKDKEKEQERGKDKEREREREREIEERERPKRLRANDGASPMGKEHGQSSAVLKEAKDLKHTADKLVVSKGKGGMEHEVTGLYLNASLKFLQAASMLESGEHNEKLQSLKIYVDTAKLCEFCAVNYERAKHFAAVALAYKCAAVARMRVVQARSSSIRDKVEILTANQQVVPNESPNSSVASDVDNLNTLTSDKVRKGGTTPTLNSQTGGTFFIPAKNRTSFDRILEYVGETVAAMESLSKSSNAFAACEAASSLGSDAASSSGMDAAKKVMDFGFHDVESLVRLVREAMEAMGF